MSVSELNHLMTYVIEGWMLFSAGFTSVAFVSFVARRVQEDIEAAELALVEGQTEGLSESEEITVTEAVEAAVAQAANQAALKPKLQEPKAQEPKAQKPNSKKAEPKKSEPKKSEPKAPPAAKTDEALGEDVIADEDKEKARLEEVAAVSEKLAKSKEKQSNAPSVSVSTGPQ